ncbi:sigma-E factor negative regulatory protein [Spiribacter pallidus]|jgi:sigma-E factor negative regulatory protein RseA|uniref:RseA family anti-sigma factor n=1 Tax=Spiribacter pallidus TaxID=1987936 RepID=A0ABV3T9G9_9GAMM
MHKEHKEQLSALVDGELDSEAAAFMTRRVGADDEARALWQRYQTVSAVARGEYTRDGSLLADRVGAAIAEEPAHGDGEDSARGREPGVVATLLKPAAGMAIAASVALALVSVWPMVGEQPSGTSQTQAVATTLQGAPSEGQLSRARLGAPSTNAAAGERAMDAEARRWLNPYLVNHSEHAASGQLGGTLKYARIVGHDAED